MAACAVASYGLLSVLHHLVEQLVGHRLPTRAAVRAAAGAPATTTLTAGTLATRAFATRAFVACAFATRAFVTAAAAAAALT